MSRRSVRILLLIILAVQCLVMVGWSSTKQNGFLDEYLSLARAHYYYAGSSHSYEIEHSENWRPGTWVETDDLRADLAVPDGGAFTARPFTHSLKQLLTDRNYMGLLNIVNHIFAPDELTFAPGIGLNIALLALTGLLLFSILRALHVSGAAALFGVIWYGFSADAVNTVTYVRFYMLVSFLVALAVRLFLAGWQAQRQAAGAVLGILALSALFLAFRDSELSLILAVILTVGFAAGMLCRKRILQLILFLIPLAAAVAVMFPQFVDILRVLRDPGSVAAGNGAAGWIAEGLLNASPEFLVRNLKVGFWHVGTYFFAGTWSVYLLFGVLAALTVFCIVKRRRAGGGSAAAGNAPEADHAEHAGDTGRTGETRDAERSPADVGFAVILAAAAAGYEILLALAGVSYHNRYHTAVHVLVVLALCFWIDRAVRGLPRKKPVRVVTGAAAAAFLAAVIAAPFTGQAIFYYLYPEDAELLERLEDHREEDTVLLLTNEYYNPFAYDCVHHTGDGTRVLAVYAEQDPARSPELPESFLVWTDGEAAGQKADRIREQIASLESEGYIIELLGEDHISAVYTARRGS
ncbi:MAG: hypothetical protein II772_08760 [Lachnospiraceae bacterium]|nr:hypothetical protein [Lachnospiraceae bacterium]